MKKTNHFVYIAKAYIGFQQKYQTLNNTLENSFSQFFTRRKGNIDLGSKPELVAPHTNTVTKDQSLFFFEISAPWNNLPSEMRNSDSLYSFKMQQKVESQATVLVDYEKIISAKLFVYFINRPSEWIDPVSVVAIVNCYYCRSLFILMFLVFNEVK